MFELTIYWWGFAILASLWVFVHYLLMPRPIRGVPYNQLSRLQPWGDLGALGIYSGLGFGGEIYDWFSLQCLGLKSPLVQVFMPPISTTHPVLILSDLREVQDIVTKRTNEVDRAGIMHTWFGLLAPRASIGLKSKTEGWRKQRSLWNVIVNPPFLKEVVFKNTHTVALELVNLWKEKVSKAHGMAFDAREDLWLAMLEETWRNMFNTKLDLMSIKSEAVKCSQRTGPGKTGVVVFDSGHLPDFCSVLDTLVMCLDWVIQGVTPRGYTWLFRTTGILSRAEKRKDKILDEQIRIAQSRLRQKPQNTEKTGTCAVDLVLEKDSRAGDRTPLSNEALRDEALELLLTGRSTTSGSFMWVLRYLMDHTDVQNRLRQQLLLVFGDRDGSKCPSAEAIATAPLPYLDAVLAETLRCSATVPVCFRETILPCTILGHDVPAGTPLVLLTAGSSYRSPNMPAVPEALRSKTSQKTLVYKTVTSDYTNREAGQSVDTFDPARWLVNGKFDAGAVHMLPFSAGPRGCFGKKIALLELRILTVVLLMHFELPKLAKRLSSHKAVDGLSRKPRELYVNPRPWCDKAGYDCGDYFDA